MNQMTPVLRRVVYCLAMAVCIMMISGLAPAQTSPQEPAAFELTADTPWVIAPNPPEALARALEDVKADWYKVLGHMPVILDEVPESWKDPVVYLGLGGDALKGMVKEPFSGAESFILAARRDGAGRTALVATGGDLRGAIYAAYALSEELLGVDPWYFWTDHEPEARPRIAVPAGFEKLAGPPTFKYRGWFINDEDLLSAFAPDPVRENIISLEMWDRVYETLLRLHGNMVVPGTFTFPDERAQELASRRGLILHMHHILTVGLNTYRWPKDVPFSYTQHPEIMERYWQTCIDAFKGKEVVWTVGYRGKHDRPFWTDEPGMDTPEARGAAISKAIAKQVELIQKAQPGAPMITNLWMEGAKLYHDGFLKIPEGVTIVWPDDGTGVIQDQGRVQAGQGIYYHTAMLNGSANQLGEMVSPGRIYNEVGRFARAGATAFFLVNVSDIRPYPLSTDCAMKLVWNAKPYVDRTDIENMNGWFAGWCRRQYGEAAAGPAAEVYGKYFNIPYHRRTVRRSDNYPHTVMGRLNNAVAPLIKAGKPLDEKNLKTVQEILKFTATNRPYVAELAAQAEALLPQIPASRREFYTGHLLTQARLHLRSQEMLEDYARALEAYGAGKKQEAMDQTEKGLAAIDGAFTALHAAEYGKWAGWYRGEGFVGLDASRDRLRVMLAALRGEEPPPVRARRTYEVLYQYQEPFQKNFPLLYPPGRGMDEEKK